LGSWGYKVEESDTFADVYDQFFDEYNNGATPEVATASVRTELGDYFVEYDDQYDAHFALALAQWETQSLEQSLLREVEQYIESGADLRNWEERGADPSTLKKRAASLSSFLSKLRTPRPSKKRRRRPKFDFHKDTIIEIAAPDGTKTFSISEQFSNSEYTSTLAWMEWANGGGGRVFSCRQPGLEFSAQWLDSQNLKISVPKTIEQELRSDGLVSLEQAYFCGDEVKLHCEFV
jgi:hypothetical protein